MSGAATSRDRISLVIAARGATRIRLRPAERALRAGLPTARRRAQFALGGA
jgi:hypothetical protein